MGERRAVKNCGRDKELWVNRELWEKIKTSVRYRELWEE